MTWHQYSIKSIGIVGKDVTYAMLHALNSGKFPADFNHILITLIPKKKKPEIVSDYRHISLCNVIYKLISKVLANKLKVKVVLPHVISSSHSAFVPGCLTTDNIFIAYELVHFLSQKEMGKWGICLLN